MFEGLNEAMKSVEEVGKLISKKKLPKELCPFVIGVTSSGRVSQGAQEILKAFPHEYINANELQNLFDKDSKNYTPPRNDLVYITIIESEHMYQHKVNKNFIKAEFYENPENYESIFAEKYVPYLSILIHCMFWDTKFPRILTLEEAHNLSEKKQFRLMGICDITCDLAGSIELLQKFTTIEDPFFTIDPLTADISDDFEKMTDNSIIYHAVDHLPAELPIDASKHFSDKLTNFLKAIVDSDYPCDFEGDFEKDVKDFPVEILNACETWNGKLMPKYDYLYKDLEKSFPEYKDRDFDKNKN